MIKYWIFLAVFLSWAGITTAQTVPIRSGEHSGYTRLVAQVPVNTKWLVQHTKNGARLSVEMDGVEFETGTVFRRLTQNRLISVSQKAPGAALDLEFGCECVARAFLYKDTMIVVDIAPGKKPLPLQDGIPPLSLPKAIKQEGTPPVSSSLTGLHFPLLNLNVDQLENQLSTQMLQGADRNLLDLNLAPVPPSTSSMPSDLEANINVTSILNDLNGLLGPDLLQATQKPACISDAELGFEQWTKEGSFPEQVAVLRVKLFQEFDHIDPIVVVKLAKLYAYYGFGAESQKTLDLLNQQTLETSRISTISRVLDGASASASNPFSGMQGCKGNAALWAVLTENTLAQDAQIDSIEQSFTRLPRHIRRLVGPQLSDILTRANQLEAARRVTRAVDRIETQPSVGANIAKAGIAEAEGKDTQAKAHLTEVTSAPEAKLDAPLALARLIEKRWSERGAATEQEIELLAAYSAEFRKSEVGPSLIRAQAVALSLGGEFDRAVDISSEIALVDERKAALNRVWVILTERADDTTFLRRALSFSDETSQELKTETALAVAERLTLLGFAKPALALVNQTNEERHRSERAILRARAAILSGRPHQALLELGEDSSDTAIQIKRQALEETGSFQDAADLMKDAGQIDTASRLYWLADAAEAIDSHQTEKYAKISENSEKLGAPPARVPDKPLADAESLLLDSQDARQRIKDILGALD